MGKSKRELQASYRALPHTNRFWLYSESCYTEEELSLREWILKTRTNSGIDRDYLTNPSSWFGDDAQALINVYEHSWFYSNAYRTRQILTLDDFHVLPIDSQRLQWTPLYDLMQNVGDYLILRNQNLPTAHLNQPMNFVFLDINNILKGLSQNPNIAQVKDQLEVLNRYVRTIEKNISPNLGSDRLFLANFRRIIDDKIEPHLTHMIESQLLKERLGELLKTVKKLSLDRNRILHFALNINTVNPHPYDFSTPQIEGSAGYPTQSAKKCAITSKELTKDLNSILRLTKEQLKDCPNFKLIEMDEEILSHYAEAITDLHELDRFQQVISEVINLLGQAGEVYTVSQFKEQMLTLLKQINGFIDESSQHVEAILHANTQAYHKAIQAEQDLTFWQKWLTTEKIKLKTFIKNHDTLAQFPSTSADLIKTNKELKGTVTEVISHLSQPKTKTTTFEGLAGQAQHLDRLMGSMHQWIKIHYEFRGLEAPKRPELLKLAPPLKPSPTITVYPSSTTYSSSGHNLFFTTQSLPPAECLSNNSECRGLSTVPESRQNSFGYLGLLALIPIGLIFLYLIVNRNNKKAKSARVVQGSEEEFNKLRIKFEDLIAILRGIEHEEESDLSDGYEYLLNAFRTLMKKAQNGIYNVKALQKIYDDLEYYYKDTCGSTAALLS